MPPEKHNIQKMNRERRSLMNQQQPIHRRRLTRAEIRRRRRNRAIRRIAGLTLVVCVAVGGVSFLLSHRKAPVPTADAAGSAANSAASSLPSAAPSSKVESSKVESSTGSEAASESVESRDNLLGLTAAEAKAMLADPLMILVNHTNQMPENYTFETAECGSKTAVNKTLQTVACNAFLELQKAAAAENVTVWMQSGYRSVSYQTNLYEKKTNYYKQQGYDDAKAKEMAAAIVNPPGYSEHNCGLAADLNSPEHTGLDEGFENTAAFRWLCQHAGEYGFILRYPKGAEEKTEITYEPWHWRYVGVENAAKINASGLCFEDYIAALQQIAG
ncbi:D-alanyl-D-alanine carboxypeptidase family protein [Faecalibacterium prausnitzii]|nr:D-alanyl-D-alanine carboxypeptidase family protein [Faecalibacterium prausnitzii]